MARSYVRGLAAIVKQLLVRPDVPQALMLLSILGYVAQLAIGSSLEQEGARLASRVRRGELHRLLSSLFLHSDPLHLYKCVFGLSRLAPAAASIYGGLQCLGLFLLSGACGNLAALHLEGADGPAMGASGALLGLDGALLAYTLRHGGELGPALRRTALTLAVSCVRPWLGPRTHRVDHAAHVGGYLGGAALGLLLSPHLPSAAAGYEAAMVDEMCDRVALGCGESGARAEMAMLRYLRLLPEEERSLLCGANGAAGAWELGPLGEREGAPPPRTEDWQAVWGMIKEVVLERAASLPAEPPASHDTPAQRERRRERMRGRAEEEVILHFHDRARVALPYMQLRARGLVSLRQMRRRRLSVGSPVPPFVAEALCGALVVAAAASWRHAAAAALQDSHRGWKWGTLH